MKIIYIFANYWWIFIALSAALLFTRTGIHHTVLLWLIKYDGQFWWVPLILSALFFMIKFFVINNMTVQ